MNLILIIVLGKLIQKQFKSNKTEINKKENVRILK